MASITIITGSPGCGKTTLARTLAARAARGVHLASDVFYAFPSRPIDPTTPESHAQNTTIVRALARSAWAFAEGGYAVFLDGIVGPWFLPTLRAEIPRACRVDYVILRAALPDTLRRVRQRDGPGGSQRVRHVHRAFEASPEYAAHRVDTTALGPEALADRIEAQLREGRFALAPRPEKSAESDESAQSTGPTGPTGPTG